MNKYQLKVLVVAGLLLCIFSTIVTGQHIKENTSVISKEILASMDAAAADWNNGNLNGYMALYDKSATMMTKNGRIGIDSLRGMYEKHYFNGGTAKQQLSYENYQLTM